ncbi:sugar ABC transporter permease [Phytohabitans sp. LJ34]|uniref:sugar ABC transporter permease n=1 Tax=Phytohabitans sp. LJ34 TaxID=3452217 RepID=UPI003F8B9DBA
MTITAQHIEPAAVTPKPTVTSIVRDYIARIRGGDLGALPAVLGLVVLCVFFGLMRPAFFSERNFANLFTQGAGVAVIAMGLVFVLLLGEIDLSAGFAAGVCAAVLAQVVAVHGYPWYVAVLAALATGVVIGLVLGFLVAKVGIPSFVVTLAAFLAFQGTVLLLIKGGTNISIGDDVIVAIENNNMPPWLGWALVALAGGGYAAVQLLSHSRRQARGLVVEPIAIPLARIAGLVLILGGSVYFLNLERSINPVINSLKGVPIVVPIIGILLIVWTFVLRRTAYGRHIYAVGGNREAARRAGINVDRIRISVFVICSFMAAIGGKGRVMDAVLGGAVIAVIDNGMGLMELSSGQKFVFTGSVLLLAAGVDALSRRRAAATGIR